jgi:predicted esterase
MDTERSAFAELAVEGFRPVLVSLPADRSKPSPVVVAAHGAGDGPRYQCEFWRELLEARTFVLCPTGVPFGNTDEEGHFFRNHLELEREVMNAAAALRAAYGDQIAPGPLVYAAYSQGATMGALMLPAHGDVFTRLILIEGGFSQWNVPIGRKFRGAGGERVLFACGTRSCNKGAERSAAWLEQAGLEARVEYVPGGGHTYGGAVGERVASSLDWVFEGDVRLETLLDPK